MTKEQELEIYEQALADYEKWCGVICQGYYHYFLYVHELDFTEELIVLFEIASKQLPTGKDARIKILKEAIATVKQQIQDEKRN